MRNRFLDTSSEEVTINLTPLIDVVFVVLIIFILIAPMLEVDRVDLATGASVTQKEMATPEGGAVVLHVHADNTIWMNGKRIQETALFSILKEAKRHGASRPLQLFHDRKASFGTYQSIKNAAEEAGFEELDVILKPG
jgi:biopolymer transport protein ExbD